MLNESINDQHIFKALFMAGGPGSGKSFIVNNIIGKSGPVSALGAVVINSDDFFEAQLKKLKLPTKFDKSKPEQYAAQMQARFVAKMLATTKLANILNGMLPVVIDGTGKDSGKVVAQVEALSALGYDCDMAFVDTTLEVALQRNRLRARSLSDDEVEKIWKSVQSNKSVFHGMFGSRFHLIDNSNALEGAELKAIQHKLFAIGRKVFGQPIKNPVGNTLFDVMTRLGLKYISDLGDETKMNVLRNLPDDITPIRRLAAIGEAFERLPKW